MNQNNKKSLKILIGFLFIFIFLLQVGIQADINSFSVDEYTDWKDSPNPSIYDLSMYNESIEECDDVCEDINYNFSADLIDSDNCSREFQNGWLETYSWEKNHTYYDSMNASQLDNRDDYIPSEDNFTIINGTMYWNDNLTDCDGVYTPFNGTEAYHYPATWSFTNEDVGDTGDQIDFLDADQDRCSIIEILDGHRKVMDYNPTGGWSAWGHDFDEERVNGTIEFWIRFSVTDNRWYFEVYPAGGLGDQIQLLFFEDASIRYIDDGGTHVIGAYVADTWYHLKIEWDCTCKWYLWIDGVKIDTCGYDFLGDPIHLDEIRIMNMNAGDHQYLDAFGESWEEYQIGDNYHWQYYSSEPYDFEDDDLSTDGHYYGDPTSFTDDECSESCEYYGGNSDAFSFVGETGETGTNIEWVDQTADATKVEVSALLGGHCEILNMTSSTVTWVTHYHYFDTYHTGEYVEFWMRTDNSAKWYYIQLREDASTKLAFGISGNNFVYADHLGGYPSVKVATANIWYHSKVYWYKNVSGYSKWSWWIDGCLEVDDVQMGDNFTTGINRITIATETFDTYHLYLDAYGESWDATYSIGDNCNPYGLPTEVSDFIDSYSVAPYTSVSVIPCLDGHKKVLNLTDESACGFVSIYNTFSATQTLGTVEWWWRTSNCTPDSRVLFYESGNTRIFLNLIDCTFKYYNGSDYISALGPIVADTWYHHKIIFDVDTDTFDWYIDCVLEIDDGDFIGVADYLDQIRLRTTTPATGLSDYFDAFGYSWETYTVSDNINPYGRPVDLSEFIDSHSITCDVSVAISGEFGVHKKFINLTDDGTGQIKIYNNFESSQTSGTVEWWWLITDNTKYAYVEFNEDATSIIYLITHTATFRYHSGGVWQDTGCPVVSGYWHHHRIDFECGSGGYMGLPADTMDWYIDGVLEVDNGNFRSVSDVINKINIKTYTTQTGYSAYYDAIQYSWDPNCDEFWDYETSGWVLTEGATAHINIIDQLGCHYNVLNISDKGGTPDPKLYQSLTDQITGCVSFNLMIDSTFASSDTFIFELREGGTRGVSIQWRDGYILNHWDSIGETWEVDTWYNIRVCFNCTSDNYTLYIDDIYIGRYEFSEDIDNIDNIYFRTMYATDDEVYIDDIDYSWVAPYACDNTEPDNFPILEFEINLCMDDLDYICYCLYWAFNTSSTYNVTFEWFNFDTNCWEILNYSMFNDSIVCNSQCETFNYTALDPYLNGTCLKFRFYVYDYFSEFYFYLDQFYLVIWSYIHASEVKTFCWRGIWDYTWILESFGVNYTANTIQFEVIPKHECCNFQAISESDKTTKWVLMGSDIVGSYSEVYDEDFDAPVARYWDLYDVDERYFSKSADESSSYLLDNSTLIGIDYTGTHFDVGAQDTISMSITWDGTYFWYIGSANDEVYKYTAAGVYTGTHWDVGAQDTTPRGITWDGTHFWVVGHVNHEVYQYTAAGVYTGTHWDVGAQSLEMHDITWDGTFFWITQMGLLGSAWIYKYTSVGVYTGIRFDVWSEEHAPVGITWDGTHLWIVGYVDEDVCRYTTAGVYTGDFFHVGDEDGGPFGIAWDGNSFWMLGYSNLEVYEYDNMYTISKNYHGAGYAYMQTDTTETLNLRSPTFADVTLTAGSYFTVNYTTTTNNEVNLLLYDNGIEVMDLMISTYIGTNIVEIYVNTPVTFDQLLISGVLEDTEYFEVFNISAYYLSTEVMEDMTVLEIDPDGMDCIAIDFGDYELKIYELNTGTFILKDTRNVTIPEPPDRLIEYYVPPTYYILKIYHYGHLASTIEIFGPQNETIHMEMGEIVEQRLIEGVYVVNWTNGETGLVTTYNIVLDYDKVLILSTTYYNIFFTLSDSNLHIIDDSQYTFRLNGTIKEFGFIMDLETDDYNITVHDRFGVELFNEIVYLRGLNEYDIIISLYELQIRHLAYLNSNISINGSYSFIMAPDSIRSFHFGNSTYNISWINGEDGVNRSYLINLDVDYVLALNTTYYEIYLAKFAYDGYGFGSTDLVRFYINNERKDFGFNTLKYDTVNLRCLDYFNETLYDEDVYLRDFTEWNIFIEIWSMHIKNNYTFDFKIKIERNGIETEQFVLAQWEIMYRFAPNVEYKIVTYYLNGTEIESREIEFEQNGQIISFGFYSVEVPIDPRPVLNDFMMFFWFLFFAFVIVVVLYINLRNRYNKIPEYSRRTYKKKKNSRAYDKRMID